MGNLITDSTSIWVRVRNGNTFPVLLGKSCSELDEYNPKDLVSFPDFLLFFFLWHCHCLLPACPSKNPNKPTFLHLYVHHLLLLPLSAWHLQEEEKKGCFLVALFKVEEKEQEWLVVNGDTVYSKLWFIFFKRSKYFTADFLFTQLLGPNSAPMFQLTGWIKHKSSIPGVTGIVSFIQKEISGETLSELVENYLTLVILFFCGKCWSAEVNLSADLRWLWGSKNQEQILRNWKNNRKRDWKNEKPWPTWLLPETDDAGSRDWSKVGKAGICSRILQSPCESYSC